MMYCLTQEEYDDLVEGINTAEASKYKNEFKDLMQEIANLTAKSKVSMLYSPMRREDVINFSFAENDVSRTLRSLFGLDRLR